MFVLQGKFDLRRATTVLNELLALAEKPERLAERLNLTDHLDLIQKAIAPTSFSRLTTEVAKKKVYYRLSEEQEKIRAGKWVWKFLGKTFAEKKINELEKRILKLGSLLAGPYWFYQHERVWLLDMMRDHTLNIAVFDPEWVELEEVALSLPLVEMFKTGDVKHARLVENQLERRFSSIDPTFILRELEGQRAVQFNLETKRVIYTTVFRESE